ncbi:MAG: 4-hydroxy-tetrahydrodipicolinate synthase [Lentisphaerae bacterium]|nr:4-hydroxy-tetrahydrodipicolinate synthase [Lentisphaerota bacterium]
MFKGVFTALVTPFTSTGDVDYTRLKELVEFQVENGVDGIVPMGTTGESPTLSIAEHNEVVETVVTAVAGRVKVVAGTGGNSTSEALELTKHALAVGADASLQVTPYYNKPSQEGLYRHFSKVADLGIPVILYNVPGRTSREITADTVVRLATHPNIVALKEAGGSVERVSEVLDKCNICILSGDDPLTLPMMVVGAKGVISVASNVAPKQVSDMVHHALDGNWEQAIMLHKKYFKLFKDMFIDTNPIPVKAALAMMGKIEEEYRLPLCEMTDSLKTKLAATQKDVALLS